ncbi:MAG: CHAP domain-containing protein, partial [Ruminococcus sp.]|nr:CHAP domain-containing protein [Ruminococcus sp.]
VEECNRAWTSSSADNDNQAVTIEIANDGGAPNWHVSDAALAAAIELCVDVCKRNGIAKLNFTGDKSGNLTMHKYFAATGCPGPYLESKFPYIASEVNKRLGADTAAQTANFTPRLTAPSASDKHWLHTSKGGLNECIHISGGSVLPNCVGYAWGRFYEIIGEKPSLSKNNAEMWYGSTADGYKRSQTPELGAVACWSKGAVGSEADGAGHVAVVERIEANGDIVTSNSAYGGSRFYTQVYKKSAGYNFGAYKFQGFILPVKIKNVTVTSAANSGSSAAFKVGDIVNFTGTTHYASSTGTRGTACKSGRAKITRISANAAHPYHLVNDGSGSTVYGWVNAADIAAEKSLDELAREVIRGDWGNGDERKKRLTEAGYDYTAVQKRVGELMK